MSKRRRNFTSGEKVAILRSHFLEGISVSDLCERHGLRPTQFYHWQKQFFENGEAAFERRSSQKPMAESKKIAALESKLRRKDEVLGELMEEHVALKKTLGEL